MSPSALQQNIPFTAALATHTDSAQGEQTEQLGVAKVVKVVKQLATTLMAERTGIKLTFLKPEKECDNTVTSQIKWDASTKKIKDKADWLVNSKAGELLKSSAQSTTPFLSPKQREQITVHSILPHSTRKMIGLLRAPDLNESELQNADYNLDMAQEALILGAHLRNQIAAGHKPAFHTLWEACREWRVGHLDQNTNIKELENFCRSRLGEHSFIDGETKFYTPISTTSIKYGYLLSKVKRKVELGMGGMHNACRLHESTIQQNDGTTRKRVSLQYLVESHQQFAMLTELRTVLNENNEFVEDEWSHPNNMDIDIDSFNLESVESKNLSHGVMLHTRSPYLEGLEVDIDTKFQDYTKLIQDDLQHRTQDTLRTALDLENPYHLSLVKQLGDLHYYLAQSALDFRGSASKSELFIRTLAVACGIELPAFEKGYVPDLEAFIISHPHFVVNYPFTFELA